MTFKFKEGDYFFLNIDNGWIIGEVLEIDERFETIRTWFLYYVIKTNNDSISKSGVFHQLSDMYIHAKKLNKIPNDDELLALVL